MKKILLSLATVALLLGTPRVSKGVEVSFDFFYNNLQGGSWVEVADYGYCWQPDVVANDRNWRPYSDGYWAYTDLGWTWVSYEDFGWATYHYGRWVMLSDYGWVWAPGQDSELEWGPAWVSWRTGGDYVGWAPLPPEVSITGRPIIEGSIDAEYDIGPAYYNFVEVRYIGEPVLRERIVPVTQNVTYISQTVNITNITVKNKVVYNYGPDINVINQRAARPIQRLKLERQENVDVAAAARSGALTKVQGDRLVVAAPMTIKKPEQLPPPPRVKARITQPKIDKGWSVVGDPKAQAELRQKIKTEDRTKVQIGTGQAGVNASVAPGAASVSPNAATNAAAGSPQQGQGRERGRGGRRGGAQDMAGTSPTTAMSPGIGASPAQGAATEAAGPGGRRGQGQHNRFPQGVDQSAPTGAASPAQAAGATSNVGGGPETGAAQGGGGGHRGRRGQESQSPPIPPATPNAANGPSDQSQQGPGGRGPGRRREMQNNPAGQDMGQGQGAGGQGRQGRHLQAQPGESAPGDMQGQGAGGQGRQGRHLQAQPGETSPGSVQEQGGGGRHQHEQVQGTGQGAQGERPQGQGDGQGQVRRGGKKGQAEGSPAPTPQ